MPYHFLQSVNGINHHRDKVNPDDYCAHFFAPSPRKISLQF